MLHEPARCVRRSDMRQSAVDADPLNPTIFHEPWWLDAATDGAWRESTSESGGRIMGRLPYLPDRKFTGQLSIVMPRLTRSLGPALAVPGDPAECVRLPTRHKILRELICGLPRCSHLWMQMHGGISDVMMFESAGCHTTVRYTTEIAPAAPDDIWAAMRDKTRNVIRRARDGLVVDHDMTADDFLAFYQEACRTHGRRNDYPASSCGRLIAQAITTGRGRAYAAVRSDGQPTAAIMTVSDARATYYLMSSRLPDAGNGAVSMLLWAAIRDAAESGRTFDGDGLSLENHMLLTGLGGQVRPRYLVSRTGALMGLGRCVKEFVGKARRSARWSR